VEGHLLKADRRTAEKPGILRWNIAGELPANRLLILRASAGGEVAVFRHMPMAGGFSGSVAVQTPGFGARVLAKAAVAVDSLEVKAPGFNAKVVEVAAYEGAVNVALTTASDRWGGLRNAPVKSDGCGKPLSTFKTGVNTYKITSAGLNRQYIVELPANYNPNNPYRLVFGMHWMGGSDQAVQGWSKWFGLKPLDKEATTIFVAPNGAGNPPLWSQGAKDHTFFDDLVKLMDTDLCIDRSRIFSLGFSFGAMFSNSLAQTHQDVLRGIVVFAAADVNIYFPANTGKPMAYMGVHGISDPTCTIQMGRSSINRFVKNNGCTVPSMVPEAKRGGSQVVYDYKCPSSHPVRWVTFDGKHTYPPNDNGTWVHPLAWEFITQF
jgi:poly(3-hydroxybutyrate) depolymerase